MSTSNDQPAVVPLQTIELPAKLEALSQTNALLASMLTGPYEKILFKTQLIVEELLTNICSYAYDGKNGSAKFACGVVNFDGQQAVMIQLTDHGLPYDPFANAKEPDLEASIEERAVGGLGIHLIKEIASHYAYMRVDNCNQTQIILNVGTN